MQAALSALGTVRRGFFFGYADLKGRGKKSQVAKPPQLAASFNFKPSWRCRD
jgi:hypothetical protein